VVARSGSIARASAELRLAQSTISDQIRTLEAHFARALFTRQGGRLGLTELGYVVFKYAENIFALGRELQEVVRNDGAGCRPLAIGLADVVPKLAARRFLEPAFRLADPIRLVCREDRSERLLAALAEHQLDLVLCDTPPERQPRHLAARSQLVTESAVVVLGTPELCRAHRPGFPGSLAQAPMLLPTDNTEVRRAIDVWLAQRLLRPSIIAEFEDSALLAAFGESGLGLFPAPLPLAEELIRRHGLQVVGTLDGVHERYYALSLERSEQHPAFVAITAVIGREPAEQPAGADATRRSA
jgi:LysR family transcriptional activator of nhaA